MNQARNMHTASNLFITENGGSGPARLMYYRDKSHLGRASQPGSCNQALTMSCIVTQLARESFGVCRFRGSRMREIDLI